MSESLNDLNLDLIEIPRVGPGRQPADISLEYVRDLSIEDLKIPPVAVQTAPSIKKIRDTHHALARVLASGESEAMASAITGYSLSRISILKADPQFNDLLEFYRNQAVEKVADFRERMVAVGMSALAELGERLEDNPDAISSALLKDIVKDLADRTGHAPKASGPAGNVNVNISLRDSMAEARARVNAIREANKTIEHSPEPESPPTSGAR